ncbi:conserved phage C-terminal domain-containing protein, partial [Martelella alba]
DQAKQVLTHLNQTTGSRYQVSKSSLENIRARLGEGFAVAELVLVVDYSVEKWGSDLKMAEYLRPATLFQPTKFPGYLQTATKWEKAGRPPRSAWGKRGVPTVAVDQDCDAAYRRFIGSSLPIQNPSELEIQVRSEASKAGVRQMQTGFAVNAWNRIWREHAQRGVEA